MVTCIYAFVCNNCGIIGFLNTGDYSTIIMDYEDYNSTSKSYDEGRSPVGIELILGAVSRVTDGNLKQAHLVDIGCGTGNYAVTLSHYVGKITGVEYNSGMREQAIKKTVDIPNVEIIEGDATNIPLPDGYCDAVLCTQVTHHLPGGPPDYDGASKFIRESYRILKGKGAIILNTCTGEQQTKSWFVPYLIPNATKRIVDRYPPIDVFSSRLQATGYNTVTVLAHRSESFFNIDLLLDPKGPFDAKWRGLDSIWALATPDELEQALSLWRKKLEDGTADEFIKEKDAIRREIGNSTSIVAYKNL